MKKLLIWVMVFILTLNVLGCNQSSAKFNFGYEIKEEYVGKINEELAQSFIEFTKDTVKLYDTMDSDFKESDLGDMIDMGMLEMYMYNTVRTYESLNIWNIYEKGTLELMEEQRQNISDLMLLTLAYSNQKDDAEENEELELNKEYFDEEIKNIKISIENTLEGVEKYMK